ncbi:TIGR03757 family integrating conjugative element protein [Pseudomonas sp. Y39-6]|uniref:TIGR03757 family integrating conjugative element protein n=1 Tax=Pseudomonas sp. Y39-6 TaxID=2749807 RepID=UPI001910FC1B|nr:TIGR03757 family integrating conjugative element protein [Pseudomonas sp. Y39-6]QPO21996.1 TIGR03757 family integrating conjugative element protein [Pseudomonas sp. Y39-6]URS59317.1 TIGR03757 family integrating conjugative element protein [Pseudomonas sp. Y39-6]
MKPNLILISLAALVVSQTSAAVPWVITDSAPAIEATNEIRLILIDQLSALEDEVSSGLPSSPDAAEAMFGERMTAQMSAKIENAHQDIVDTWSLGVTKIPAVVADGKYVIYGDSNVERALTKIPLYREAHP